MISKIATNYSEFFLPETDVESDRCCPEPWLQPTEEADGCCLEPTLESEEEADGCCLEPRLESEEK